MLSTVALTWLMGGGRGEGVLRAPAGVFASVMPGTSNEAASCWSLAASMLLTSTAGWSCSGEVGMMSCSGWTAGGVLGAPAVEATELLRE